MAAAFAMLPAAGCGGGDDQKSGGGGTASTPAPSETQTATPSAEATATPTAVADAGTAPVAEGTGSADGGRFVFRILELQRSGPTVVVNAQVSLAGGSEKDTVQVSDTFSDGLYQKIDGAGDEAGDIFDGIALIDPEGRKKYLVARDSTGACVCSNNLSGQFVSEDTPVSLEATLSAPPETVTKVNVVVPNVKTFIDVPIS